VIILRKANKMREFDRIKRIQQLITEIWVLLPDYRYFQLISLLEYKYEKQINCTLKFEGRPDLFYVEDDKTEKFLKEFKENL